MCHRPGSEPQPCPRQEAQRGLSSTPEYRGGHPDTLAGARAWQPAGQHPLGPPEGFRGCTQCWVPLTGGGATAGCSPFTPLRATSPHPSGTSAPLPAPPPPDKRLKVQLCQLPSPGRVGEVTMGRASAPWSHPTGSTSTSPGCLGRPQQPEQHRRVVAHQKWGVQQEDEG